MMDLMLHHGAQPLPHCNGSSARSSARSYALLPQIFRGKPAEDRHRLLVHVMEERQHVFRTIRQFRAVAGIAAGLELNVFRIHTPLDRCQVADDIGKAEFAFSIAPVVFFRRDAGDNFQRSLADFFPVVIVPESGDFAGGGDFHKAILLPPNLNPQTEQARHGTAPSLYEFRVEQSTIASTTVPSGDDLMESLPPTRRKRSCMLTSPRPSGLAAGSKPMPVSLMQRRRRPASRARLTVICLACPCVTALFRASCVTRKRHKLMSSARPSSGSASRSTVTWYCCANVLHNPFRALGRPRCCKMVECNWRATSRTPNATSSVWRRNSTTSS